MKVRVIFWQKNHITLQETVDNVLRWIRKQGGCIKFVTQSESVEGLGNWSITIIIWYEICPQANTTSAPR